MQPQKEHVKRLQYQQRRDHGLSLSLHPAMLRTNMKRPFAVTRTHGKPWQASLPLEGQQAWQVHADFMDALTAEGFVVLGGPLEGTSEALLIIRAESPDEIHRRLQADPWTTLGLLTTTRVAPWTIRLGSLP
jgi:uncharacterized protein YciI